MGMWTKMLHNPMSLRILIFSWIMLSSNGLSAMPSKLPNIIFILVDDMGYSDIGCYGGEIQTPHLDRLAENGMRFTSMYNTSKCFPSRACLLTGVYAQQCQMGKNPKSGIQNAITIAELLKTKGYRTLAVGKHHSTVSLYDRGFDRFYGFHYGEGKSCANHFNPGLPREGEGIPARKKGETRTYCFDEKKITPYFTPESKDWYTTDYFTKWALQFLDEHREEEKPYFLYVSYTAPHDPLHAWPEDIKKYEKMYQEGFEHIRKQRLQKQIRSGLWGSKDVELSPASHRPWDSLNEEQKQDQIRRMQVYAAMIDRVDQNIGHIIQKVEELGETENTLIMFASDNGSSAENVNYGYGEIGSLTRWASLQKDWANVSNTPFKYWKNLSHEGGILTPFIVHWPNVIKKSGTIHREPAHFIDIMATIKDITTATYPNNYDGKSIVPLQGISFLPVLHGESVIPRNKPLFWEYGKGGAIRDADWKLVSKSLSRNNMKRIDWELYNLKKDFTEHNNLANQFPEKVKPLSQKWLDWYREVYQLNKE